MDPCWKNLPDDLVEKVCNFLPKVRRIDPSLSAEIRNQWFKFDQWFLNARTKYELYDSSYVDPYEVMYDDLLLVTDLPVDVYPSDMLVEQVVEDMWKKLTSEERDDLLFTLYLI